MSSNRLFLILSMIGFGLFGCSDGERGICLESFHNNECVVILDCINNKVKICDDRLLQLIDNQLKKAIETNKSPRHNCGSIKIHPLSLDNSQCELRLALTESDDGIIIINFSSMYESSGTHELLKYLVNEYPELVIRLRDKDGKCPPTGWK